MRHAHQRHRITLTMGVLILLAMSLTALGAQGQPPAQHRQPSLAINGYPFNSSRGDFPVPDQLRWDRRLLSRYQVVQFTGPVQPAWKETLTRLGVRFFDYLPDYGFIVRIHASRLREIRDLPFVAYAGPFEPAFRLSRRLEEKADSWLAVNIILFEEEDTDEALSHIERFGGTVIRQTSGELQAWVSRTALIGLTTLESVRWVEEARPIELRNSTTSWKIQSGTEGYRPVWDRGLKGEGQIIGVADSGIDWDHECFYDPAHPQVKYSDTGQTSPPDLSHRKVINYWRLHADGMDSDGHGTHVAGTLACDNAYLSPNSGNANGQGMAPKARLSFTDLTYSTYFPLPLVSDVPRIFNNQLADNAMIHNNSWGESGHFGEYTAMTRAMDEYMWNNKGFLVLVANGNRGESEPPATAKNIVSVAREDAASLGPTVDGRIKPTVVAPGLIVSAASDNNLSSLNFEYRTLLGTSMATPAVAGGLALIRQYFMDGWYPTGQPNSLNTLVPSAALLKAVLLSGASEITTGVVDYRSENKFPNNTQGWGFINLDGSLYFAGQRRKLWIQDQTQGLDTGEHATYTVTVTDTSEPFRVILAWTDYPGAYGATQVLVNNLNLRVQSPDGKVYLGNVTQGLNPGRSVTGGTADQANVEEGVYLPSAQYGVLAGTYTITVEGFNVPQGPQPFALVVVGGLEGGGPTDTTPPTVLSTAPGAGATDVPLNATIAITFSEEMNHTTVTNAFSIQPTTPGSFGWNGPMLLYVPTSGLSQATQYTVTISNLAMDQAGNRLPAPFHLSFSTLGGNPEPTPQPPRPPGMPSGPAVCYGETPSTYFASTTDVNGDDIAYLFDWGDGTTTTTSLLASGARAETQHTWSRAGTYSVRVQAKDETGRASGWSSPLSVSVSDPPAALITASTGNGSVGISSRVSDSQQAQIFKSTVNSIQSLSLALAKVGTLDPNFRILVTIHTYKTSSYLAYGYIYPQDVVSTDPASPSWVKVTFNKTISVSPGSYYYLVLRPYGTSGGGSYQWRTNSANPYPDGMLLTGSSWTQVPGTDALMKTPSSGSLPNIPPSVPGSVEGPGSGNLGVSYAFSALGHDANGESVRIVFDWGDGNQTTTDPVASGTMAQAFHAWQTSGTYQVRAKAIDSSGLESGWGGALAVEISGADTTLPQITTVAASNVTQSGAIITWNTDELATTVVEYGTSTSYGSTATGNSPVTSHSVQLSGLSPDAIYHFRAVCQDLAGNTGTSQDFTFKTLAQDVTPPQISGVHARFVTTSTARITWETDEPSTSYVDFGATTAYGTTQGSGALATAHSVEIGPLTPATPYHYRVRSADAAGAESPGSDRTFSTRAEIPWTAFHSYQGPNGLVTELQRLSVEFPEITQLASIGQTHQGRDIWALKISDNPTVDEDEPEVLIDGGFHGDEWIGGETASYIAYQLVNNYGLDADVTRLINEREIWVIPLVNPDGRIIDSTGDTNNPSSVRNWRRNGRDNNQSGSWDSCDGVDLNRNFDLGWGIGASTSTCNEEYRGPSTFSEPESQALRTFANNRDIRVYASYHSSGRRIYYPWGYLTTPTSDDARYREVGSELMTYLPTYTAVQAGLYGAEGGASDDWMYQNFRAMAFTMEVGSSHRPATADILSTLSPHFNAALYLINLADNPWNEGPPPPPTPPAAAFSANPTAGQPPLQVQFTDQSTGDVTAWDWDFGDGATSGERNPLHIYAQAGGYTVSLTASGPAGSDTETKTTLIQVTQAPEPPAAAFAASLTSGTAPLQVQFTDQSTGEITSWAWSFGDGNTSTERNPLHTYTQAGTFTVSLTVTGPGGNDSETKTGLITVSPGAQPQRVVVRIDSTSADALVYGNYFYSNSRTSYIGYYSNNQSDSTFWFGNVWVPKGAAVVHAEIRLQAALDVSPACAARIVGFAQDYPAPVYSVADWLSRQRTNASALWNMEPWLKGRWYSSPEIASIVQEIIDRPGWVSGRGLTFSIGPATTGTGYRTLYERDNGYGYGAELIIDYLP